jgi:phosphoenolpyruvate carboxylase
MSISSTGKNEIYLPTNLKSLIRLASDVYGKSIEEVYGKKVFNRIESIRVKMKGTRKLNHLETYEVLKKEHSNLKKLTDDELYIMAHILSSYLELINRCEAVYRKHRLEEREGSRIEEDSPYAIIYVFTAHPTEARSPKSLELFKIIEKILLNIYIDSRSRDREVERLKHLFKILLKTSMAKVTQPRVEDEAHQIYSTVLDPKILLEQVKLHQRGVVAHFRTWVGGDKDGHPFVDAKVMKSSLQESRSRLLVFTEDNLRSSMNLFKDANMEGKEKSLVAKHVALIDDLKDLRSIKINDGKKVKAFRERLTNLLKSYTDVWGDLNFYLKNVESITWLYPALVLPLEFREDSEVIESNGAESKKIKGMMKSLKEISTGFEPRWYVRGFVLSMVKTEEDIINGIELVKYFFNDQVIPVVPLFETKQALLESKDILTKLYKRLPELKDRHKKKWFGRFEVMLGYSDSAKENGTLTSRFLISKTLVDLDKFFKKHQLTPVFFHGNGGSVERGGGSIKEQINWWPKSAVNIFKSTIQGEMVGRNFGSPEVMRSQVAKIYHEFHQRDHRHIEPNSESFKKLVEYTNIAYQDFVTADSFPAFVSQSTPYSYLDQLKIGSRPSSRSSGKKQFKIRAIPWVLCWTQTRVLFPTWWGIGSAWESLKVDDKYEIMQFYRSSSFFSSFMKILGFTLKKVELGVFRLYLEENLSKEEAKSYYETFSQELQKAERFFHEITREESDLWFRPWLGESIDLRAPMIHPLNLIQLISLERKNSKLLRETVTGIASGMMTTG